MQPIIIYVSFDFKNKNLIEEKFNEIKKIYCHNFDLLKLKKILSEYEYIIYLDDNTNYNYDNLINDI